MNLSTFSTLLVISVNTVFVNAQPTQLLLRDPPTLACASIDTARYAGSEYLPNLAGVRIKFADAAIVTLTLLLAISNGGLLWSAWRAQRSQRISSETQMRSYIGVTSVQPLHTVSNTIEVIIKNGGQTPAYDVAVWLDYSLENAVSQHAIEMLEGTERGVKSVSGPLWNGCERSTHLIVDNFDAVKSNRYFVFGIVAYKDVFGAKHFTTIQCHANYNKHGWSISHHSEGNKAT